MRASWLDRHRKHAAHGAHIRSQGAGGDQIKDRWLLTYADLITLLLALFIFMYSFSRVDSEKYAKLNKALSGIFNATGVQIPPGDSLIDDRPGSGPLSVTRFENMRRALEAKAYENGLDDDKLAVEVSERGLVIHLMESAIFKPGGDKLSEDAMSALDLVADQLRGTPNHIRVEGHTDNVPIHNARFASNWELSSARATAIVRYLVDAHGISPRRISALGFGEFRPISPNTTPENRARNRRVDIVALTSELSEKEPNSDLYVTPRTRSAA